MKRAMVNVALVGLTYGMSCKQDALVSARLLSKEHVQQAAQERGSHYTEYGPQDAEQTLVHIAQIHKSIGLGEGLDERIELLTRIYHQTKSDKEGEEERRKIRTKVRNFISEHRTITSLIDYSQERIYSLLERMTDGGTTITLYDEGLTVEGLAGHRYALAKIPQLEKRIKELERKRIRDRF